MKLSSATYFLSLSLGLIVVTNADFNGLRRLSRSNNARKLSLLDGAASSTSLPELVTIGNNGSPADVFPLGECKGDCDKDDDCEV